MLRHAAGHGEQHHRDDSPPSTAVMLKLCEKLPDTRAVAFANLGDQGREVEHSTNGVKLAEDDSLGRHGRFGDVRVTEQGGELSPDPRVADPRFDRRQQRADQVTRFARKSERAPVGLSHHDHAAGSSHASELSHRLRRIAEVLERSLGACRVEHPGLEREAVCIPEDVLDRIVLRACTAAGALQQCRARVKSHHPPGSADDSRHRARVVSKPAPDVDRCRARPQTERLDALALAGRERIRAVQILQISHETTRISAAVNIGKTLHFHSSGGGNTIPPKLAHAQQA
jgi:hypothetical protein